MTDIFKKIEHHLLNDERPSEFIFKFVKSDQGQQYPYSMIGDMRGIPQSTVYHPEGDVLNHTLMVVDNAAKKKEESVDPRVFMWSALLHDLGKIKTTRTRRGRITAYNHDQVGEEMAAEFLKKTACDEEFKKKVCKLVRWHMQTFYVVKGMNFADIQGMKSDVSPREVALLSLCDRLGRGNANSEKEIEDIKTFLKECNVWGNDNGLAFER